MKSLKVIILSVMVLALAFAVNGCCTKCCSPSIEVGICAPPPSTPIPCDNLQSKFQLWTWNPITNFPGNTIVPVLPPGIILPLTPYLPKVEVTNYSNVEVRGVTVVFYWAAFGLFDYGTPIGAVGVDFLPNESKWVRGPWSFVVGGNSTSEPHHICLAARVFHPCDTWLTNNYAWANFGIVSLSPFWKIHEVPFNAGFQRATGPIELKIDAPKGIRAWVVPLQEGNIENIEKTGLTKLDVKQDINQELSLIIENAGANDKEGDTFDVTVSALQKEELISSFTVRFKIGK